MMRLPQAKSVVRNAGPGTRLVVAALLATAAGIAVLAWVPGWIATTPASPAEAEELRSVRTAVLAVLAGSLAVVGAITAHRGYVVTREGQVTERFTRAVDQLGSESLEIRLGGIYAMERIARESRVDHGPIIEIVTAWLRVHARQTPSDGITTDVQAALTALGRRRAEWDRDTLVLDDVEVPGADLVGARLNRLQANRANLRRAHFMNASIQGATLSDCDLQTANFTGASMRGADLSGPKLKNAMFVASDLGEAQFIYADLSQALLINTRVAGADFSYSLLSGAALREAVGLNRAAFVDSNLKGVDLHASDLAEADLRGANLSDADLRGADLRGARLDGASFKGARVDGETKADVDLVALGAVSDAGS